MVYYWSSEKCQGEIHTAEFYAVETIETENGRFVRCRDHESDLGEENGGWDALLLNPNQVVKIDIIQ